MQHRLSRVLEFWDRSKELSIHNNSYRDFVNEFICLLLKNDIKNGDLTTNSLIKGNKNVSAFVISKQDGILAGLEEFSLINNDLHLKFLKKDGDKIKKGDILIKMNDYGKKILERERISLNLLQRMSGIATLTNNLVAKLGNIVKLAATRKTLWSYIDKKGVSIGGGLTHRLNLNDGIIIKDNHMKILKYDIKKALGFAKNKSKYIEIEVENKKQALNAARAISDIKKSFSRDMRVSEFVGVERERARSRTHLHARVSESELSLTHSPSSLDLSASVRADSHAGHRSQKISFAIMLDKISPNEVKSIIEELKNKNLYEDILFEASGNITTKNLKQYITCGVDIISMGCLTNSVKSLDMSLKIK